MLFLIATASAVTYGPGVWNGPLTLADGDMLEGPLTVVGELIIPSGATVTIYGGIPLDVAADVIRIEPGGVLNGRDRGGDRGQFGNAGEGPAPGLAGGDSWCPLTRVPGGGGGGGGAGAGGDGGAAIGGAGGGASQQLLLEPGPVGSGGGSGGSLCPNAGGYGGFGGGSVYLVADLIVLDGAIIMDGAMGTVGPTGGGGGGAGSVTLIAQRVTGSGDISIVGGVGGDPYTAAGGAGGGGGGGQAIISGLAWDATISVSYSGASGGVGGALPLAQDGGLGLVLRPVVEPTFPVCAGQVTLRGEGFTPGGLVAVVTGDGPGHTPFIAGPCAGVDSQLAGPLRLITTQTADAGGGVQGGQIVGQGRCGRHVRLIDLTTCVGTAVER